MVILLFLSGKWHLAHDYKPISRDRSNWTRKRGFEKYSGIMGGLANNDNPRSLVSGNRAIAPSENFYLTDALTDTTTVKYIHNGTS